MLVSTISFEMQPCAAVKYNLMIICRSGTSPEAEIVLLNEY